MDPVFIVCQHTHRSIDLNPKRCRPNLKSISSVFSFGYPFFFGQYLAINSSIGFFPQKNKYWVWTGEMRFFCEEASLFFFSFVQFIIVNWT